MEKSCFICPVCGAALGCNSKSYHCENGHCFDIAKKGYVNLLMSQSSSQHGDSKEMIASRAEFLNRGFYDKLSAEICSCVLKYAPQNARVLDAGCGECKYTFDILKSLSDAGKCAEVIGIDISKEALIFSRRRGSGLSLAVASTAELPVAGGSVDVLISIFAPFSSNEFSRVVKDSGVIIQVYPLARHLWELKELIYDEPYENPTLPAEKELVLSETRELKYKIELESTADILSLFEMTPYFHRTSRRDKEKLLNCDRLSCSVEFGIAIYKKITE
mgnify:CR=1 FL=1